MSENSKKNIFNRLQSALKQKTLKPYPEKGDTFIFETNEVDLKIHLTEKLAALGVLCFFYNDENELKKHLEDIIQNKNIISLKFESPELQDSLKISPLLIEDLTQGNTATVTGCMGLIARTGTILVSSSQDGGRTQHIAPDIHIVLAEKNQIVYNINDVMISLDPDNLPSVLCFISGASRTADIEKTLVMGAHGPKELYVFIKI